MIGLIKKAEKGIKMKRWDELTEQEQNNLSDGMKEIAKIKMNQNKVFEDLRDLYKIQNWTDKHHDIQQRLFRQQDELIKGLEIAIFEEIKTCNGCIQLELTSLARVKDKNSSAADCCIRNIQIFANQITDLTN